MTKLQVKALRLGLYRIYWKSGGDSLAAVGQCNDGAKWLAPVNWVSPTMEQKWWRQVQSATYLGCN